MKKSNVFVFSLLAVVSVFLLWLWYFLGLNHVDEPLDLVLSIIWWVVIVAAVVLVVKMEKVRRERIRTVYVGDYAIFNSERGLMSFGSSPLMIDAVASVVSNLEYDFTRVDFPDSDEFDVRYFVRTEKFKLEHSQGEQQGGMSGSAGASRQGRSLPKTWKGEVVIMRTKEERAFESPDELAAILSVLERPIAD